MRVRVNLRPGRPSDAERRHGRPQIDAVVLRGEACDEAREPLARRLRPHPEEAGRGAKLEEQGLLARGERDGLLEAADRVASLAAGRGPGEQPISAAASISPSWSTVVPSDGRAAATAIRLPTCSASSSISSPR